MTNLPRHEEINGSDLTGASGTTNRTYDLANSDSITAQFIIVVDGAILQNGVTFTKSGDTITFLSEIFNTQTITLDYFVDTTAATVAVTALPEYTTTLKIVRVAGIGVQVENETLGTGDGSEDDYDVDNANIIAGSYTVKYGDSGSNTFVSLTDSDDYVLDKDGGTIVLTSAGLTKTNGKVIYIDYLHSPKISDTILDTFIAKASREVEDSTSDYWGSATVFVEYFDGEYDTYPRTERPYSDDYTEPVLVQLSNKNVLSLVSAYELLRGMSISKAWRYDTTLATYTDVTSESNTQGGTAFQPFADTTAASDYLYIGTSNQFHGISFTLFTVGVTGGTNTIEYYNGTAWTAFTVTESTTGVLDFEASGKLSWTSLSAWTKVSVNSSSELYWIRIKANSTYSTEAKISVAYVDQDFVINQEIPLYQINWNSNGQLTFGSRTFPNGVRNLRIEYQAGYSSTPSLIDELASLYGARMAFVNITGGSFDEATGFTLGRKSVQIGEAWVNVKQVLQEINIKIQSVLDQVGRKMDVI